MRKQIEFRLNKDAGSMSELVKKYFLKFGFKILTESSDEIVFEQGNAFQNMVTFNPLKWRSKIKVKFSIQDVLADFDINTSGQMASPREEQLWDSFINNFKRSISENIDLTNENMNLISSVKRDSWNKIGWFVIGAVIFGVPAGLLGYFTGVDMLAPLGGVGGGLFFMMYKMSKDINKKSL